MTATVSVYSPLTLLPPNPAAAGATAGAAAAGSGVASVVVTVVVTPDACAEVMVVVTVGLCVRHGDRTAMEDRVTHREGCWEEEQRQSVPQRKVGDKKTE